MSNEATYEFTHSNQEMAEKQYHYLRNRGVEGKLEKQGNDWVLSYIDIGKDFYIAIIEFYEQMAFESDDSNRGKKLIIDVNKYESIFFDLEEESIGDMWKKQSNFFRNRLREYKTTN